MKSTALVTGSAGFIGSHLVEALNGLGYQVTGLDLKPSDLQLSVADPKLTDNLIKLKPEIVFHLAAASSVLSPKEEILTSNIAGTYNLLSAAASAGARKFIFASSAAVYGSDQNLPITETAALKPTSDYGLSKLTGELYCQRFASLKPTILRFSNVYGPRQNFSAEGGAVAIFIDKVLSGQAPTIFGDGKQSRDFINVNDVVSAMIKAIDTPQGFFNVSTNSQISVNDLLATIQKLVGTKLVPQKASKRSGDIRASRLDNAKIKKAFSWQPKVDLTEGLTQTINYFKNL